MEDEKELKATNVVYDDDLTDEELEVVNNEYPHEDEVDPPLESHSYNNIGDLKGFNQWSVYGSNKYVPTMPTIQTIPPGFYEVKNESNIGNFFEKKEVNTDELYELPNLELQDAIEDIEKFWNRKEIYESYGFLHKRGILMYGAPGNGKSGIIQLCAKYLIEKKGGIVVNVTNGDSINIYNNLIGPLRSIEKERPLIVILEDIEAIAGEGSWSASLLLNLLDGVKQIDNVVYIATTNYPEKLEERISNRPSRFDRRYEITAPGSDVRRAYINNKLKEKDLENINIEDWIKRTEGMSLAHLKELIISVFALGNTFEDTIDRLKGMKIKPKIKSQNPKVGFRNTE